MLAHWLLSARRLEDDEDDDMMMSSRQLALTCLPWASHYQAGRHCTDGGLEVSFSPHSFSH